MKLPRHQICPRALISEIKIAPSMTFSVLAKDGKDRLGIFWESGTLHEFPNLDPILQKIPFHPHPRTSLCLSKRGKRDWLRRPLWWRHENATSKDASLFWFGQSSLNPRHYLIMGNSGRCTTLTPQPRTPMLPAV